MDRLLARIERWLLPLLAGLLAFITVGVFVQVVLRYAFATSFLWGEELSLFAFIWCIFLGAAICVRRRQHFAFDLPPDFLGPRAARIQRLLIDLLVLAAALLLLIEGWTFSQLSIQRLSPALGITLLIPTLVIPLSGAFMVLILVVDLARDLRDIWTAE
ncbi:MAG TPA: TRAP transporter small permease [Alphaproteobacteria bacterium]|nr:TRAP transporter small permease [Alphaproteobacteria bacterium]